MLLPSKSTTADQALITVAGQILLQLDQPRTISATWEALDDWRRENKMPATVPFWWFALAVDVLYAAGAVDLDDGTLRMNRAALVK